MDNDDRRLQQEFVIRVTTSLGYELEPLHVTASSLREALSRAYALPIIRWFPEEHPDR